MVIAPPVKPLCVLALVALGCASAPRANPAASGAAPNPAASAPSEASNAPAAAPSEAAPPTLTAPSAAELDALRPLLDRGPAFIVRDADGGARARITVVHRARAPLDLVRRAVSTPGEYAEFMPVLRSVDSLGERGNRRAFRFHVAAPMFDVTALCEMRVAGERRVDVTITQSETGPGGSRWDFTPDGDRSTLVSLTTWGDPSQGHWLLRQVARRSPSAIAGMNISVDSVLVLGTSRRAENLAGLNLPVRPADGVAPSGPLEAPAAGPWQGLTRDAAVVSTLLTPEGAVRQVTVAGWTPTAPEVVLERLRAVADYRQLWGSMRDVTVIPSQPGDPAGSVRWRSRVETPLSQLEGVQRLRVESPTLVWHDGLEGDFADHSHRWDLVAAPGGGTVVMLTGDSDLNRAGWITRAMMQRDPWLLAGFAGSWKIVWLRHLLRAVG